MNMVQFKQDIIDLLSHKKGGHVQKWLYSDHIRADNSSGSKLWHNFITSNESYYPIQSEIDLIPILLGRIKTDYDTIIDFGLGDISAVNNKIIPILRSQPALKRYVAIDISDNQLTLGTDIVQTKFPQIQTQSIKGDFYKTRTISGTKRLGIFLGSTISNQEMMVGQKLPEQAIINRLITLGHTVKGNESGSLIISSDANPNLKHALNAYQHPSWIQMMTGLMYDIQDLAQPTGNFNPSLWHYAPVIDDKNHVLHQVITPTVNQSFAIDEHEFNIKKGEQFVVKNNFKYPLDLFTEIVQKAGLTILAPPIQSQNNPMAMLETHI